MDTYDATQFVMRKTGLLNECIAINEKLLSTVDDLDLLNDLIDQRGMLVHDLDTLNVSVSSHIKSLCTQEQKDQMDRLVTLIIDQDQELITALNDKRTALLNAIKENVQTKNVVKYAEVDISASGSYMDIKK